MCMIEDGERAVVYSKRMSRAKKQYQCAECRRTIARGEQYHRAFMVYDGYASTFRTCQNCAVAVEWLTENCGGAMHGGIEQDISEHVSEYPRQIGLMRLKIGMNRRWRRFDGAGLMPVQKLPPTIMESNHA